MTEQNVAEDVVTRFYLNGDYAERNPDWDTEDSPWKAARIADILRDHKRDPKTIVEIGCGAGEVMRGLQVHFPKAEMTGYDIAPDLKPFWDALGDSDMNFVLADYLAVETPIPDVVLLIDVIEHLGNPFDFLDRLRDQCSEVVLHFPLDLSSISVLRESPLLHVRHKVGHLHFYTKGLVMALMEGAGYEVIEARYTGASFTAPQTGLKSRLAGLFRRAIFAVNRDVGARLLGGETLMVLARPKG